VQADNIPEAARGEIQAELARVSEDIAAIIYRTVPGDMTESERVTLPMLLQERRQLYQQLSRIEDKAP
jgi:hypothetical protein